MGASLAESWTETKDGLVYEFKLRRGLKFHNGDPVTAEDVKFSFDRYNGAGAREFRARVRQCEIVDPLTVRFTLKEPWPDFMTFYGTTATAAGIVLTASSRSPSARGRTSSSASGPASRSCWRPTRRTGGTRPTSRS
jgi:ABC-type transport system substrate-binding protein